jgi:DNA-binding MarR family transcriptional regulator
MVLKEVFNQDNISLSQLASNMLYDISTLSRIVNHLIKKKLLQKKVHKKDKRIQMINLSSKGLEVLLFMEENLMNKQKDILEQLQPQYRKIMLTVIKAYEEANRKMLAQSNDSKVH